MAAVCQTGFSKETGDLPKVAQHTTELLRFNFFLHTFKPTLPTAQHSAVMQAIYYKLVTTMPAKQTTAHGQ